MKNPLNNYFLKNFDVLIDEGYIKFHCIWTKHSLSEEVPESLIEWRNRLFKKQWIGFNKILNVGYGNISVKTPGGILISGTQTGHIAQIKSEHFTLVDKYDIIQNKVWCKGPVKASSETLTHAAIYECHPSIKAVIHIHNRSLWRKYLHQLPTTSEKVPYGTPEMAKEIHRLYNDSNLAEKKLLIMGGHEEGIISFGSDLNEAGELLFSLTLH